MGKARGWQGRIGDGRKDGERRGSQAKAGKDCEAKKMQREPIPYTRNATSPAAVAIITPAVLFIRRIAFALVNISRARAARNA